MTTDDAVRKQRFSFRNKNGEELAALLEAPSQPAAYVLFAHCFTCSKDIAAATRISRALAAKGMAVVRFDFTGLGNSEGDFANTNFSSNVEDLLAAADHMRATLQAPAILVGHSLGGAAVLAAARSVAEARAVVTIGAPADPAHVRHLFEDSAAEIEAQGQATVKLAGREFRIRKQFLDDIAQQRLESHVKKLRKALLIFHAPADQIVDIDNARKIFEAAKHPKSFISLDDADHLLSRREDSQYVADTLAAWASRYVRAVTPAPAQREGPRLAAGEVLVRELDRKFKLEILTDTHRLLADEPVEQGGTDVGPSPYELLLAALGACTAMTVRIYAGFKKLPLERVSVQLRHSKIHAQDCAECETKEGKIDQIERELVIEGSLSPEQRQRLLEIANKCPVHRTLTSEIDIRTILARAP